MTLTRRHLLSASAAALAAVALPRRALAQSYPARPVRVIVPFAAGGPNDLVARLIAQGLSDRLGKQFYVENIGGAGGNVRNDDKRNDTRLCLVRQSGERLILSQAPSQRWNVRV